MWILFVALGIIIPLSLIVGVVYFVIRMVKGGSDMAKSLNSKEVGIEIGMFMSLLFSIISVVEIIFAAIDKKFVDVLSQTNYGLVNTMNDDVRMAVSIAAIAFPIYLALAWTRASHLKKNAERRQVEALKYSQYAVMLIAALFIVGTLMFVLYNWLGGSNSTGEMLKALTVIVMSLVLGSYNYFLSKRTYTENNTISIVSTIASLVVVFGLIAYSVSVIGSPAQVRKIRFDEKRIENLSNIQSQVLYFWQRTKALPVNISELNSGDVGGSFILPTDPVTKAAYEYKVLENSKTFKFEICATFETERNFDENGNNLTAGSLYKTDRYYDLANSYYSSYDVSPFWNHGEGKSCFTRTIDPARYTDPMYPKY